MRTDRNHTESKTESARTTRGGLTVALSAALLLLTVLSSLVLATAPSGAVEVGPAELIEEPGITPGLVEDLPLLPINKWLQASVIFACDDHNGGSAFATVINSSPSQDYVYSFEVKGPEVSFINPVGIAPGTTSEQAHYAGSNGDSVEAWVRDGNGITLAHEKWTVDCGQPKPWATFEQVCKGHDAYVVVTLGNDGTKAVNLDVFFVLASLLGGDLLPASRTVDPGETQTIEYVVEEGETYSVRVYIQGQGRQPLAEETITVDCHHEPTRPDPKPTPPAYTPPPTGTVVMKFTG